MRREEQSRVDAAIERLQIDTRAQARGPAPVRRQPAEGDDRPLDRRPTPAPCSASTRPAASTSRTKREIYRLLRELAAQGTSVLFYTSELEEVQLVCDRAVVIFGGRVVDALPGGRAPTSRR